MAAARLGLRVFTTSLQHFHQNTNRILPVATNLRCISLSHNFFKERRFTERHEWIEMLDNVGTVGITDYAQDKLGEIVYVSLPDVGSTLHKDDVAAELESVKAAAEVYSPSSGSVQEINSELSETPNKINSSPFDEGWLFKLELSAPGEVKDLMDEDAYKAFIEPQDEE